MKIFTTFTVLISAIFFAHVSQAQNASYCQGPVIIMDAMGEVESIPDIADVSLNIQSREKTEIVALEKLSENMNRVIEVLQNLNIKDEDIRTDSVSVSPVYDQRNRQQIIAYAGRSNVHFKTYKLDTISDLINGVMAGSNNMFSNISYSSSEKDALEDDARRKAFAKVQSKAELYAELSGNVLGSVCTISEGNISTVINPFRNGLRQETMMMADRSANISFPIKPGKMKTSAHVSVIYELVN